MIYYDRDAFFRYTGCGDFAASVAGSEPCAAAASEVAYAEEN
jgi:hypothetical protein